MMSAEPLNDLFLTLRQLHRNAGEPSSREIAKGTNYSHTTITKAMSSGKCPSWPVLNAIVKSLNGESEFFRSPWVAVRDDVAPLKEGVVRAPGAPTNLAAQGAVLARASLAAHQPIQIAAQAYSNAEFVDQAGIPEVMTRGQTEVVSITMKNTGNTVWSTASAFHLGTQSPHDNELWLPNAGNRVLLPILSVVPGESVTFLFMIASPRFTGLHTFQWRMLQENVTWFGERTKPVDVTVS
jgi:hypothetical protein